MHLAREASELYFELSQIHFHIDKLSWTHYLDRMSALTQMCQPNSPIHKRARRILLVEEWNSEAVWPLEEESHSGTPDIRGQDELNEGEIQAGLSEDEWGYLQFLSRRKGLNDWIFHQYDPDFHPSVPHGHFKGKSQPKLDSYLGWVYQSSKQIRRLRRNLIIELWNDEEFRVVAQTAIEWYMAEFPRYNWRVSDPLMLPRRRR